MENGKIFELIPEAMRRVGAIGKDSVNQQQKFRYRGIDAVYNALNPVMSDLGLFIVPEILDHRREERQNANGTILKYSILTIKYTMYAPDGSNVACVVVGEGMDSGDKASNKAMSIGLKYACFQLFMIPTEETAVDPDAETHEITSGARTPAAPKQAKQENIPVNRTETPVAPPAAATVTKVSTMPQTGAETPANPVLDYLAREREELRKARGISPAENIAIWKKQTEVLRAAGHVPTKPLSEFTQKEASNLVNLMYSLFDPMGTEIRTDEG
jgi:hypothetical protein